MYEKKKQKRKCPTPSSGAAADDGWLWFRSRYIGYSPAHSERTSIISRIVVDPNLVPYLDCRRRLCTIGSSHESDGPKFMIRCAASVAQRNWRVEPVK